METFQRSPHPAPAAGVEMPATKRGTPVSSAGAPEGGSGASQPAIAARYPNLTPACNGRASHFGPEDAPFNLATALLDWAEGSGLLH